MRSPIKLGHKVVVELGGQSDAQTG